MTAAARPEQHGHGIDWLGTWAKRQVHYNPQPQPSLPAHIPGTPQASDRSARSRISASAKKARDQPRSQGSLGPASAGNGAAGGSGGIGSAVKPVAEQIPQDVAPEVAAGDGSLEGASPECPMGSSEESDTLADDEEGLRQAAWRWRFNRRWAQEQARQMDPEYGRQVRPVRLM